MSSSATRSTGVSEPMASLTDTWSRLRTRAFEFRLPRASAVIGVIAAALVLVSWWLTDQAVTRHAEDRFEFRTAQIEWQIIERMRAYEQILRGGAALFAASEEVTRDEWRAYVRKLAIQDRYPGLQGIGYTHRIPPEELEAHLIQVRAEGFPDYTIRPRGERDEYFSIIYLEPFDWRNQRAFGYDMYTEETRRTAMDRARDMGQPAISGVVKLMQETESDVQPGFLMYVPVYRDGFTPSDARQRRDALAGFVYSPFRAHNLMNDILGPGPADIGFEIHDHLPDPDGAVIYTSRPDLHDIHPRPRFTRHSTLEIAGQTWQLWFASKPAFEYQVRSDTPNMVLMGGAAISLLLFAVGWTIEAGKHRATAFRHVVDSALDGIIAIDHHGRVLEFNTAAEAMFRIPRSEALGRELADLIIPEDLREDHRRALAERIRSATPLGKGRRFETRAMRADGSQFPAEISVTRVGTRKPAVFSGFVRDISRRVQQEGEIRRLNADLERRVEERTAELRVANAELEAFAYSVSHDLRAPLRAIDGFSLNLLETYGPQFDEQGRHFLSRVRAGAGRMGALIDDLLKLSRVTRAPLRREPTDLSALAHEIMDTLRAEDPGREARISIADGMVAAVDARLIRVALENLLGNAWKFTSRERVTEIAFGCTSADGRSLYHVRDNGVGFDMTYADKLFAPFQRLHLERDFEGTGIGLATVQRIVRRHGGEIHVSASSGGGATFTFTLEGSDHDGI
ncbi:hypothetical protein B1C78_03580 [Thioalkalivibrio denitrificans]|uniref:histidine kinase n=1 Tax=Thioalkalivibrio denitrificans TaxID=108003 RepID=A0A1V3NR87_9GAMM|nr:CHASE domain-containing protein [Thioalkalivibrio denitrificans]OOG27561.1 hypothetical protein B1C78_03580 [Thioalkalivibrio denitrificans]